MWKDIKMAVNKRTRIWSSALETLSSKRKHSHFWCHPELLMGSCVLGSTCVLHQWWCTVFTALLFRWHDCCHVRFIVKKTKAEEAKGSGLRH
jgi:hypothetical protein